jgi:hypothetical protein
MLRRPTTPTAPLFMAFIFQMANQRGAGRNPGVETRLYLYNCHCNNSIGPDSCTINQLEKLNVSLTVLEAPHWDECLDILMAVGGAELKSSG